MSSGRRDEIRVLVAIVFLLGRIGQEGCNGSDTADTGSSDNLVPTYETGIEILLKDLLKSMSSGTTSSSGDSGRSKSISRGFIGSIINTVIVKPVGAIVDPITAAAARSFGEVLNLVGDTFRAIFPGTKWCGDGNIANTEDDVGYFSGTDACCRAHDNCPQAINAGTSLGPLLNDGIFTRSACFCDKEFYNCLKNVSSIVSTKIGVTYFNILRPQCFDFNYPVTGCAAYGWGRLIEHKCVEYTYDTSEPKKLEWIDNPDY